MYTLDLPILYSEKPRGECISGQHSKCLHILLRFSRNAVSLGFCCGGFSSTAGYVPGNEAHCQSNERLRTFWLFLSKGRCSFLSEQLEKSCDLS